MAAGGEIVFMAVSNCTGGLACHFEKNESSH